MHLSLQQQKIWQLENECIEYIGHSIYLISHLFQFCILHYIILIKQFDLSIYEIYVRLSNGKKVIESENDRKYYYVGCINI